MGLDMYLKGKRYLGWVEREQYKQELFEISETLCLGKEINEITFELGYWRKANAIHKWFVDNLQGGEDDCGEYEVYYNCLIKLRELCKEVLDNGEEYALRFLPPTSGGFLHGVLADVDEYYWQYVKKTYELLTELCLDEDIQNGTIEVFYRSSW